MEPVPDTDNMLALSYDPVDSTIIANVRTSSTVTTLKLKDSSTMTLYRNVERHGFTRCSIGHHR